MLDRRNEKYEVKLSSGFVTLIDEFQCQSRLNASRIAVLGLTNHLQR